MRKSLIAVFHDLLMAAISLPLAFYLRLGDDMPKYTASYIVPATIIFTVSAGITFFVFGNHRRTWRYVAMKDALHIAKSVIISIFIFLTIMFLHSRLEGFPRSTPVIHLLLLLALLITPRVLYRTIIENSMPKAKFVPWSQQIPVLLVGINNTSDLFMRETVNNHNSLYRIVGLVCQNGSQVGQVMHGVKVLGDVSKFRRILALQRFKSDMPRKVLITPDLLDGQTVSNILDRCRELGISMERLPRLTDFNNAVQKNQMRPIAIEDLLGRPQKSLDSSGMEKLIKGRRVMVTGAGGTIGSELCRQIANLQPEKLILLEQNEFALYQIEKELDCVNPDMDKKVVLGDIRHSVQIRKVLFKHQPHIVFHAAAHKHVPMVESNPSEAVLTNLIGTQILYENCVNMGVSQFVHISTDKAVHPTSVMGSTKLLSELYLQSRNSGMNNIKTIVRFGNVLGSTGSVIPLFQKQIAEGQPITVTHPEMTRYFMTVKEAVQLVLMAAVADREEKRSLRRGVYVLDMGIPLKINDLAEQMIRLSGLEPGKDVDIVYSGVREGEKLHEELFYPEESPIKIKYHGLLKATESPPYDLQEVKEIISELREAAMEGDDKRIHITLRKLIPSMEKRQRLRQTISTPSKKVASLQ
jgi:FlaA1/EpsC-like NDP-sugar epimerase